MKKTRRFM